MPRFRTHYDNLKVSRDAPIEVIHAAFESLAAKYRPDTHPGDEESARIMAVIIRSYGVISDPEKRAEHDRWIAKAEAREGSQEQFHGPIPTFQPVGAETGLTRWSIRVAAGLLVSVFVGALAFIVYRSVDHGQPKISSGAPQAPGPSAQVAQRTSPEPKIYTAVPNNAQRPARSEIDEVIRSGKYARMPRAEVVGESTGSGPSHLSVVNKTIYAITVTFYGSTERSIKIAAEQSLELDLAPGAYRVLGRTNSATVLPFVGNYDCLPGTAYESTFYVRSQIVP